MTRVYVSQMSPITGKFSNRASDAGWRLPFLLLSVLLALVPLHSFAQAIFGSVNGLVTDQSGAAVPNASITITDTDKGTTRVVVSSASGDYLVHDLIPDHYKIKVEASGFAIEESAVITVSADSSTQLNFQLKPGTASQTVEVTAEAPQLKTDRADVSTTLNTLTIEETPNLIRNTTSPDFAVAGYDGFYIFQCQCRGSATIDPHFVERPISLFRRLCARWSQ